MQIVLTALHRACQSSVLHQNANDLVGAPLRIARQSLSTLCNRQTLLNVVASAGIGACVTAGLGTAHTATAEPEGPSLSAHTSAPEPIAPARETDHQEI